MTLTLNETTTLSRTMSKLNSRIMKSFYQDKKLDSVGLLLLKGLKFSNNSNDVIDLYNKSLIQRSTFFTKFTLDNEQILLNMIKDVLGLTMSYTENMLIELNAQLYKG